MVEHELHVDIQVLGKATFQQEGNQALVLVQRDYELPLGDSCRALEEAHDLATIGPANNGEDAFKSLMGKSCKEVSLVHNSSLPTYFSATSIGVENWVKGWFLLVPLKENEAPTFFCDELIKEPTPFDM